MDHLKFYGKNDEELEGLHSMANIFSNGRGMEFDPDKCAKATFTRERLKLMSNIKLNESTSIRHLDPEKTYKYLRIDERGKYRQVKAVLQT